MSDFKVEKNVPKPQGRGLFETIRQLQVNESLSLPAERKSSLASYASKLKKDGKDFTVRVQEDGTVRIWRIK